MNIGNVKAFGITNFEYFQRAFVKISQSSEDVGSLSATIDSSYKKDSVFLKILSKGKNVSLYSLSDAVKLHFYIEDSGQINELNYYAYLENSAVKTVYTYRIQLLNPAITYKPGDANLIQRIQRADYSESDIKEIVNIINNGENLQFKTQRLSETQFFAGAGIRTSKIVFNGTNGPFSAGTNKSSTSPTLSSGADFIINKNTKKVIIRLEISLSDDQYTFNNSTPTDLKTSSDLTIKQFNIQFVPQLIYNFYSGKKVQAFIDAGISLNLSVYNNYNYITTYFDGTKTVLNKIPKFNTGWPSVPLKGGIFINKKVEIYATYSFPMPIVSGNPYGANITSYQLGVNYLF